MEPVYCMLDAQGYQQHSEYVTHCVYNATITARTRLNVKLHLHCLSFSNYIYNFRMHETLGSHSHINESQVQALIYCLHMHRYFNSIYKLKRHVRVWGISICRLLTHEVNA